LIFAGLQAEEQQHRRHCEAVQEEEDKKAEIYNHVNGDFLTEAKEQAESVQGPHKRLSSRYKGMTAVELKVFRDGQLEQMEQIRVSMTNGNSTFTLCEERRKKTKKDNNNNNKAFSRCFLNFNHPLSSLTST
jgi:hypothetical protein